MRKAGFRGGPAFDSPLVHGLFFFAFFLTFFEGRDFWEECCCVWDLPESTSPALFFTSETRRGLELTKEQLHGRTSCNLGGKDTVLFVVTRLGRGLVDRAPRVHTFIWLLHSNS
jgi:hypothetical protein